LQPPHLLWKCGRDVWVSVVVENTKVHPSGKRIYCNWCSGKWCILHCF
jgi:hypothetical protein